MKKLSVKKEGNKFKIFSEEKVFAEIVFDENNIDATLSTENKTLKVERSSTKDLILKENSETLFSFKFDYVWGGAEIVSNGKDTGYEIKGKWFKPGTRLTNDNDEDLIVVFKKNDGLEVSIIDENISPTMILATVYYHLYTSGGKLLSVLIGNVTH